MKWPITASLLAVFAVGSGCGTGGSPTLLEKHPTSSSAVPPDALIREFGLFRRPSLKGDAVPKSLLPRRVARAVGLDLSTSRLARNFEGKPVYVVRSAKAVCTYSRSTEIGNCWPPSTVARGIASATSICGLGTRPGQIATYGIVPDGVTRITVPRRRSPSVTVPVIHNIYVAVSSVQPPLPMHVVQHLGHDGRRVTPTGIPPGVAKRGCVDPR